MADTTMLYLVQWEDRFMSVIQKKDIVGLTSSSTDSTEFTEPSEGDLIKAKYKGRTYEAVISEIHPNKKYLLQQTKLPPKHFYDSAKKANGKTLLKPPTIGASYDQPAVTPEVAVSATAKEITVSSRSATAKKVTETLLKPPTIGASYDQPAVTPEVAVSATAKEITVSSEVARSATAKEVTGSTIPSEASKRKTEDRLEELKEDNRSLKRKLRRLEERLEKLEKQPINSTVSSENNYNRMVEHLGETDVLRVLQTLARAIFKDEDLVNCSRTGKKTVKCEGPARPPLDSRKLEQLERLVMAKTHITREVFFKKLENLQKTLRQKKK